MDPFYQNKIILEENKEILLEYINYYNNYKNIDIFYNLYKKNIINKSEYKNYKLYNKKFLNNLLIKTNNLLHINKEKFYGIKIPFY
jgi:hypothetical protein